MDVGLVGLEILVKIAATRWMLAVFAQNPKEIGRANCHFRIIV